MKIAIFSDIHGNAPALEAIFSDLKEKRPDLLICAGDLVGYGPFPNEVIAMVREKMIPVVMGNYDQGVGLDLPDCGCAYKDKIAAELGEQSLLWTKKEVTSENKKYLANLLDKLTFKIRGKKITVVHGSPRRINEYLFEDRPESSVFRILEQEGCDLLICGHTHLPYHRRLGEKDLVNVGSVGKPKDGDPRAAYALLDLSGQEIKVHWFRVHYDVEKTARAIEERGLPSEFARALKEAK